MNNEEIEKTLRSLEGIERASPSAFFSTRVQARLANRLAEKTRLSWMARPAYVLAMLSVVLVLNASAAFYFQHHIDQHEEEHFVDGVAGDLGADATALDW